VGDVIAGLSKREFVLRRAGKDHPEVFTTRWVMSYLRGPLTRDQIAVLMADQKAAGATPAPPVAATTTATAAAPTDETTVVPDVAQGIAVRWVDVAAPWLATVGGDPRGEHLAASIVARVALRYDDEKADLVHDEEYEAIVFPLADPIDPARSIAVDYDDRDLRDEAPAAGRYVLSGAAVDAKSFWTRIERDLVDSLVRSRTVDLPANRELKLYGRPVETIEEFTARCLTAANDLADKETAALRGKYADKAARLHAQIQAAEDRAEVVRAEREGRRNEEILSTAGSILGDLLGGRRSRGDVLGSIFGKAGGAAGRRSRSSTAGKREEAAENKIERLREQLADLEADVTEEVTAIDAKWMTAAKNVATMPISLERSDVKVTQLVLAWIPVA